MMLKLSLNMKAEGLAVEAAVRKVLDAKEIGGYDMRTGDLGGTASTSEVGDAVVKVLKELL